MHVWRIRERIAGHSRLQGGHAPSPSQMGVPKYGCLGFHDGYVNQQTIPNPKRNYEAFPSSAYG